LTFDVAGLTTPHGQTVMKPDDEGVTAVTLSATAVALLGTTIALPSGATTSIPNTANSIMRDESTFNAKEFEP
jgi:hypothetical protein